MTFYSRSAGDDVLQLIGRHQIIVEYIENRPSIGKDRGPVAANRLQFNVEAGLPHHLIAEDPAIQVIGAQSHDLRQVIRVGNLAQKNRILSSLRLKILDRFQNQCRCPNRDLQVIATIEERHLGSQAAEGLVETKDILFEVAFFFTNNQATYEQSQVVKGRMDVLREDISENDDAKRDKESDLQDRLEATEACRRKLQDVASSCEVVGLDTQWIQNPASCDEMSAKIRSQVCLETILNSSRYA